MTNAEVFELLKKSRESFSLFSTDEKITREVEEYERNCAKAKELAAQGLLDYKTGLDGFINKYDELLRKFHSHRINNPSWLITGRAGRDFSKQEEKTRLEFKKHDELMELLSRLDDSNVELIRNRQTRKALKPATYKEQSDILLDLYNTLKKCSDSLKDKTLSINDKLLLVIEHDKKVNEINKWFISERSNRYILSLGYLENMEALTNNQNVTKAEFCQALNYHTMTSTGLVKKSTIDNLVFKIRKLRELSSLYDKAAA